MSKRNPGTLGIWGPNGSRVVASEATWKEPLKWDRQAREAGERRRVFCASMADVFEDWQGPMVRSDGREIYVRPDGSRIAEPVDFIEGQGCRSLSMADVRERLFDLIDATPNLDWLLLTKRPENIRPMLRRIADGCEGWSASEAWKRLKFVVSWLNGNPPANVWLGVSCENQATADKRIPILLSIPAAVRFVSFEPLLGPIDGYGLISKRCPHCLDATQCPETGAYDCPQCDSTGLSGEPAIDWAIVGGESGPNARPCDLAWLRSIRDQCKTAGVPVFVKQLGSRPAHQPHPTVALRKYHLRHPKGEDPSEWPEDLRVQEFPVTTTSQSTA